MGYTVYYTQERDFTTEEWQQLRTAVGAIFRVLPEDVAIAGPSGEEGTRPIMDGDELLFNGSGAMAHETFVLYRTRGMVRRNLYYYAREGEEVSYTVFTKTARKPYDLVVMAVLAAALVVAPDALSVWTDDTNLSGDTPITSKARLQKAFAPAYELLSAALDSEVLGMS